MINKEYYLSKIDLLEKMVNNYNASNNILKELEECKFEIEKFSLKILFVGKFNAGKSALINAFLDRDLLSEAQNPETAIASEIAFNTTEFVELFNNEGTRTTCSIKEISNYEPDKYNHFKYNINSKYLKKDSEYTIVDMPGFNSGLERHNKAIMQYAAQGNAYILVVDCEEGDIIASSLDFIKEIKQYDNNLAIALSKSDKKTESHIKSILQKTKETATNAFDKDLMVLSTSKFDQDIQYKINTLIQSFDIQNLFEQKFELQLIEIAKLCYIAIESFAKSIDFDESKMNEEIKKRQKQKGELVQKLQKERQKLSMKMKKQVKPSIINDMENALQQNSTSIAKSLISGGDSFSRCINSIIRPVLIASTKKYTEENFDEFIEEMDLSDIFTEDKSEEVAEKIGDKYEEVNSKLNKIISRSTKSNETYRTIMAALSITTEVVAPWIEMVIVFLPDILKIFGVFNQSNQMDNLKRRVENEIIPQIMSKMSSKIENSLEDLENEIMKEIENKINMLINVEEEGLKSALKIKKSEKNKYDRLLKDIQNDLKKLDLVINHKI